MNKTIQLYTDKNKQIKGYPITSPDRVLYGDGKSIKDKMKKAVKFEVVGEGETTPPIDGELDIIKEQVESISEQLDNNSKKDKSEYINVLYPPLNLPPIQPGDVDIVPKLINMIKNIDNENITLFFPSGEYIFKSSLNINLKELNKNIKILGGANTIFIKKSEVDLIHVIGGYEDDIIDVLSVDSDGINVNENPFNKGDVVQIISEDVIGNRRYTSFQGEFFVVNYNSSVSKIIPTNMLRSDFNYSTRPRIRKLINNLFEINNIKFRDDVPKSSSKSAMITINKCFEPIIKNLKNIYCKDAFISVCECFGYTIENCVSTKQEDDGFYLGYGISDSGSGYGVVSDCVFKNVRHGFTTNTNTNSFGETHHTIIKNCVAKGTNGSSFDTHENGHCITFINCSSISSNGYSFSARTNSLFKGCNSINSEIGFYLFNSTGLKSCRNINLIDCTVLNSKNYSLSCNYGVENVNIVNCIFDCQREVYINNSINIYFKNCYIKVNNYSTDVRILSSNVTFDSCTFENTFTTENMVFICGDNCDIKSINCIKKKSNSQTLLAFAQSGTTNKLKLKGFILDGEIKLINEKPIRNSDKFVNLELDYSLF